MDKDGNLIVGSPAERQAVTNPENTIREAKRKMGTDFLFKIARKRLQTSTNLCIHPSKN